MRRAICGVLLLVALTTAQTWLEWSEWNGRCNVNGKASAQTRFRTCKPGVATAGDGTPAPCFGDTTEVLPCEKCPPQGTWGEWSVMDGCSENCGAFGRRFRTRECKKPVGCPNVPCQGKARETEEDGEPCDNRSPCLLPKRSCHADYRMSVDMEETRTHCIKRVQE